MVNIKDIIYQIKQAMVSTQLQYLGLWPDKLNNIGNHDYNYSIRIQDQDNFYQYPNNSSISDMYIRLYVYIIQKQNNAIVIKQQLDNVVQVMTDSETFNKHLSTFTQGIQPQQIVMGQKVDGQVNFYQQGYYDNMTIGSVLFKLIRCRQH